MNGRSKVYYDQQENVIFIDHSGLLVTREVFENSCADTVAIGKTLSGKVYQVICWENAKISPDITDEIYLAMMQVISPYIKGTVRYAVSDALVNITARSFSVRHKVHGVKSNIYKTKEEALAAVRELTKQEKLG